MKVDRKLSVIASSAAVLAAVGIIAGVSLASSGDAKPPVDQRIVQVGTVPSAPVSDSASPATSSTADVSPSKHATPRTQEATVSDEPEATSPEPGATVPAGGPTLPASFSGLPTVPPVDLPTPTPGTYGG